MSKVTRLRFAKISLKFTACSKPQSNALYYPRTQQQSQHKSVGKVTEKAKTSFLRQFLSRDLGSTYPGYVATFLEKAFYTHRITPKPVTSLRGHLRVIAPGQHSFIWRKCRSGGEPLAAPCPIRQARDLNVRPRATESNAFPLDQLAGQKAS